MEMRTSNSWCMITELVYDYGDELCAKEGHCPRAQRPTIHGTTLGSGCSCTHHVPIGTMSKQWMVCPRSGSIRYERYYGWLQVVEEVALYRPWVLKFRRFHKDQHVEELTSLSLQTFAHP